MKAFRPATLLKRDFNTGAFLWTPWTFLRTAVLQNTSGGCFWIGIDPLRNWDFLHKFCSLHSSLRSDKAKPLFLKSQLPVKLKIRQVKYVDRTRLINVHRNMWSWGMSESHGRSHGTHLEVKTWNNFIVIKPTHI